MRQLQVVDVAWVTVLVDWNDMVNDWTERMRVTQALVDRQATDPASVSYLQDNLLVLLESHSMRSASVWSYVLHPASFLPGSSPWPSNGRGAILSGGGVFMSQAGVTRPPRVSKSLGGDGLFKPPSLFYPTPSECNISYILLRSLLSPSTLRPQGFTKLVYIFNVPF